MGFPKSSNTSKFSSNIRHSTIMNKISAKKVENKNIQNDIHDQAIVCINQIQKYNTTERKQTIFFNLVTTYKGHSHNDYHLEDLLHIAVHRCCPRRLPGRLQPLPSQPHQVPCPLPGIYQYPLITAHSTLPTQLHSSLPL